MSRLVRELLLQHAGELLLPETPPLAAELLIQDVSFVLVDLFGPGDDDARDRA